MSGGEYVALAYAIVFVFVLVYVAIIAAKLVRLQRDTAELLELARRRETAPTRRFRKYSALVLERRQLVGRPLPVHVPTAVVRLRPRDRRSVGGIHTRRAGRSRFHPCSSHF